MSTQVQEFNPAAPSVKERFELVVANLKQAMRLYFACTIGFSAGKDSTCVLYAAIEAARQLKEQEGIDVALRSVTSDTGVELPNQHVTALQMTSIFNDYALGLGLDYEQVWVGPSDLNSYLVVMLGMRGVMTMPQGSATCSIQMKLDPARKAKRALAKEFGGSCNLVSASGVRTLESTKRAKNIEKRQESSSFPVTQQDGSGLLAPILEWSEEDVWNFLKVVNNPAKAAENGIQYLNIDPLFMHYEKMGIDTCDVSFLTSGEKGLPKSPCGGGSRGGCFLCGRIGDVDKSMRSLLTHYPAYEPLDRLARTIRAGHYVPENRNWLAKSADDQGRFKVFSNAYSASWTAQLLKYVLTIDAREDQWAQRRREKVEAMKDGALKESQLKKLAVMEGRRFPRLLTEEQQLLIAFQWARYGVQKPGEFIRIKDAIQSGQRWDLPTDEEIQALSERGQPEIMGKDFGYLQADASFAEDMTYQDGWRHFIDPESGCAPDIMRTDSGERATYVSSNGRAHDAIELADEISASLSGFESEYDYSDWLWWYEMDFSDSKKGSNAEMDFLVRSGVIQARAGYHSHLAGYQCLNRQLTDLRQAGSIESLEDVLSHPAFVSAEDAAKADEKPTPVLIATDAKPSSHSVSETPVVDEEQLDLFGT